MGILASRRASGVFVSTASVYSVARIEVDVAFARTRLKILPQPRVPRRVRTLRRLKVRRPQVPGGRHLLLTLDLLSSFRQCLQLVPLLALLVLPHQWPSRMMKKKLQLTLCLETHLTPGNA